MSEHDGRRRLGRQVAVALLGAAAFCALCVFLWSLLWSGLGSAQNQPVKTEHFSGAGVEFDYPADAKVRKQWAIFQTVVFLEHPNWRAGIQLFSTPNRALTRRTFKASLLASLKVGGTEVLNDEPKAWKRLINGADREGERYEVRFPQGNRGHMDVFFWGEPGGYMSLVLMEPDTVPPQLERHIEVFLRSLKGSAEPEPDTGDKRDRSKGDSSPSPSPSPSGV